jgi:hypothetical protein
MGPRAGTYVSTSRTVIARTGTRPEPVWKTFASNGVMLMSSFVVHCVDHIIDLIPQTVLVDALCDRQLGYPK